MIVPFDRQRIVDQAELDRLFAQRDALLAACREAVNCAERERHPFRPWHESCRAAIAACEEKPE